MLRFIKLINRNLQLPGKPLEKACLRMKQTPGLVSERASVLMTSAALNTGPLIFRGGHLLCLMIQCGCAAWSCAATRQPRLDAALPGPHFDRASVIRAYDFLLLKNVWIMTV